MCRVWLSSGVFCRCSGVVKLQAATYSGVHCDCQVPGMWVCDTSGVVIAQAAV
jgi:hypothetical protein